MLYWVNIYKKIFYIVGLFTSFNSFCADSTGLKRDYGFMPKIDLHTGLCMFAEWYKDFYLRWVNQKIQQGK